MRWEPLYGRRMAGRTLGIVGLGAIGRATARRGRAFGMRVVANRRSAAAGDTDPDVDELFTAEGLDEMIGRCDAVVISVAATARTTGMFDRHRINSMKSGAVLCNVARGSIVDEDAVVDGLRSGHLSAAVLDVTAQEPTPAGQPAVDGTQLLPFGPHRRVARRLRGRRARSDHRQPRTTDAG